MNVLTLHISDTAKIEVDNSFNGKETIKYNGEIVSEKKSLLGENHTFTCEENGERITYEVRISIKNLTRVGIDIYRNNKVVLLS
ncbi:hypothetical protein ACD591_19975 [Rufibacter glacialis]|uniref:Uncharacterized protein n=1 Tax=Rufibacter glacialis TaxID=1259555 RepID=A0A5M8Q721_9BACT|nr:hypothetical protein [Rufibacter glacialis]KAA6430620.1 hypothetical protein FOE74_19285 [Rufibacter glacialis]GGK85214.1 hypothetical protein GCM10011405_36310 [Rufibacter glacialis]